MVWSVAKREIQRLAGAAGYRIVPRDRDAYSVRHWLFRQPIHTIIDVGASTGETCKEWFARFPSAMVHAIEPLPTSYAALRRLIPQHAGRLQTYNFAIGATHGTVPFRVHPLHHTSSSLLTRTDISARLLPETREETVIEVALSTLDDLFATSATAMERDILVKLDVQGVEAEVIAGADRFFQHVKYILTEVSLAPVYAGQSDFAAVQTSLTAKGFELTAFIEQFHLADLTPIYVDVLYTNKSL